MRRHLNLVSLFKPLVFNDTIFSFLERGLGEDGLIVEKEVKGDK